MGTGSYKSVKPGRKDVVPASGNLPSAPGAKGSRRPLPDTDAPRSRSRPPDSSSWKTQEFQEAVRDAISDMVKGAVAASEDSSPHRRARKRSGAGQSFLSVPGSKDNYDKATLLLKWFAGLVVGIFTAGMVYSKTMAANATKDDLRQHIDQDLAPLNEEVRALREDVDALTNSVNTLVKTDAARRTLEAKMRRLDRYRSEYQEALADYAARKGAGKTASRPRKTQAHLDLEAELEAL